jgi:hypothetical protein
MQIFKYEIADGLDKVLANDCSISIASVAEPCIITDISKIKNIKSLASLNDDDLYYVQSILVSSSWNKNDDIFDKAEIWSARHTPEDKPTNLEHDESLIIGHITSNWPITEDGILIDENTPLENLPNKFHILTGSVIYRAFSNPELKTRAENLIEEIEAGKKYVSMECLFNGFDYGLQDLSTEEYKILPRNDNTSYLTKYLRSYGGLGEHEGYKIGRVLRNITFSGKGFVDKPANPDSIIFSKNNYSEIFENNFEQKNANLLKAGVSTDQLTTNAENNTMTELEPVITELNTIKSKLEAMEIKTSEDATSRIQSLEQTIKANEDKISELTASLEAFLAEKEEATKKEEENKMKKEEDEAKSAEQKTKDEEDKKKMKEELEAAFNEIAAYKNKEEEMAKKEKKMKRMASLIEIGLESEQASATVEKFEFLDDEAFEAMSALLAAKMPPWLEKKKDEDKKDEDKKEKKEASEVAVPDPAVLDTAEVDNGVNLSIGSDEESSIEATRAALVEFVTNRLSLKS